MKSFFSRISAFHAALAQPGWLRSSRDRRYLLGAVALILLAGVINFQIRDNQWDNWKSQPERHFAEGVPMVSTTDAAYFLSLAEDFQNGIPSGAFEASRLYPDRTEEHLPTTDPDFEPADVQPTGAREIPLLSVMIAHVAGLFTGGNLVLAGNLMIPFTVFLTGLAIGGMFWIAGHPAEGGIAAVGSGMSFGFLGRTSIGRIDTDQLMLFFTAVCLSFAMLASRERNPYRVLGYALLTALSVSLAYWWHANGLFMVVVPAVMALGIYLNQKSIKRTVLALAVFIVAVNPVVFMKVAANFIPQVLERLTGGIFSARTVSGTDSLIYPHTYTTVTELKRLDLFDTLGNMAPHPLLGLVGAVAFLAWVFLYPRKGLILLPVFALGMLSFVAGIRFAFFAAPFVWFGLGWLALCSTRWLLAKKFPNASLRPFFTDGVTLAVAALVLLGATALSRQDYTPNPSFSVPVTQGFMSLGKIAGDEGGIVTTWWDYGYYAHFHSGLDTFHDPGKQTTPRTHLLARGLTSPDQTELIQIVKFVASEGTKGIERHSGSLGQLNTAIASAGLPDKPIYMVLTHDMSEWMTSIAKLGRFDVETGQGLNREELAIFRQPVLNCSPLSRNRMQCERGLLDIEAGTLGGMPVIGGVALTRNGFLENTRELESSSPWILAIRVDGEGTSQLAMIHRVSWGNSFNQLFHLGRHDPGRMELVLDGYPAFRIYRIKR